MLVPVRRLAELETGAERLATTFGAVAHRVWPVSGSTVVVQLVMLDLLTAPTTADEPEPRAVAESVRLGRTQAGRDWLLQLRGRHTLVAGCSGAGKGSVLWGICCGLSPAVRADVVRLWGIDLKRGVELAMGEGLFSTRAYTPADALDVLRALMQVIDERGRLMAGTTRLHSPMVGDPLHVLVIDELAALTAYADLEVRREAGRMLSEILTQGRALGVVVVACVQDPRKDVVAMRGLFTQTIALRLRSVEETVMVLGDGMSRVAPAHRISPTCTPAPRGWSTTPEQPTGSAPTTGPTASSVSCRSGTPPRSTSTTSADRRGRREAPTPSRSRFGSPGLRASRVHPDSLGRPQAGGRARRTARHECPRLDERGGLRPVPRPARGPPTPAPLRTCWSTSCGRSAQRCPVADACAAYVETERRSRAAGGPVRTATPTRSGTTSSGCR